MTAFKLVVVSPFENYKRGNQIHDQELVNKICDPKDALHDYERFVRRVLMSEAEKQMFIVPIQENKFPPHAEPVPAPMQQVPVDEPALALESIADVNEPNAA